MKKIALLIEDDPNGLRRAINCAPNTKTQTAYTDNNVEWHWVKSYNEFVEYIIKSGIPDMLAFDHDLGGNSYELYHKHKGYKSGNIDYDEYDEKTGFHCAKWLIDFCLDNKIELKSEIYSHSMNDSGRKNILSILENFKKFQNDEKNNLHNKI